MSAYDAFPDKVRRICFGYSGEWLGLYPLGQIVYGNYGVLILSWRSRHAPFGKGSPDNDVAQWGRRLSRDFGEALALVVVPRPFTSISFYGRPKIALFKRFEREGDYSSVVPTDALVYFVEDVGRLDAIEVLEQRC